MPNVNWKRILTTDMLYAREAAFRDGIVVIFSLESPNYE